MPLIFHPFISALLQLHWRIPLFYQFLEKKNKISTAASECSDPLAGELPCLLWAWYWITQEYFRKPNVKPTKGKEIITFAFLFFHYSCSLHYLLAS